MHEEQRLGHFPCAPEYCARLPFGAPAAPAATQGLCLFTNGDALLGRADNGAPARRFKPPRSAPLFVSGSHRHLQGPYVSGLWVALVHVYIARGRRGCGLDSQGAWLACTRQAARAFWQT